MAVIVRYPPEGKEELVADVVDFEPGGVRSKGVGSLLQGGSSDGVAVRAETCLLTSHCATLW